MSLMHECLHHIGRAADAVPGTEHHRHAQALLEAMADCHRDGRSPTASDTARVHRKLAALMRHQEGLNLSAAPSFVMGNDPTEWTMSAADGNDYAGASDISDARRRELLSGSALGRAVLNDGLPYQRMAARHNAGIAPSLGGTAGLLPADNPWAPTANAAAARWNAAHPDPRLK